jgi:8-oxo-dGTP diphosphatase
MLDPTATPSFRLSSAVFAQRDGDILLLKRAMGAATGSWYLPGGALDPGETIEECARRELFEECGLAIPGPLTVVAVAHMHVYGHESLQILFAGDCAEGEPEISEEHSAFRWLDPRAYRERYFTDATLAALAERDARAADMTRNIRDAIDAYLAWRSR